MRNAPVKLSELIFRIPVSLMVKHQTDYYPRVPYGERSIA